MARYKRDAHYRDANTGNAIASAQVTVYTDLNKTTPATIYEDQSGGSAVTGAVLTTDSTGRYIYYVDDSDYATEQQFFEKIVKTGIATDFEVDYIDLLKTRMSSKLNVAAQIDTSVGGIVFPDDTVQTTAATGGFDSITFYAHKTTGGDQTNIADNVQITWTDTDWNVGSKFDLATNSFKPTDAGYYLFTIGMNIYTVSAASPAFIQLRRDSTIIHSVLAPPETATVAGGGQNGDTNRLGNFSVIVVSDGTDEYDITVLGDNTQDIESDKTITYWMGVRVA